MSKNKCLKSAMAFVTVLNEAGITSVHDTREHLSMVLGSSLAASHINSTGSLLATPEAVNFTSQHAWSFNNFVPVNYDLAIARYRDVLNSAYNHISSKGYTTCNAPKIKLGESEIPLMDIPEAHRLFVDINNWLVECEANEGKMKL